MRADGSPPQSPLRPAAESTAGGRAHRLLAVDRARSARRYLESLGGVRVQRCFRDATGTEHEIRIAPVSGGRFLIDVSPTWGLRAIGLCHRHDDADLLADDYAKSCASLTEPWCRELRLSDLRRPRVAERSAS